MTERTNDEIAGKLLAALENRNLTAIGKLLSDDVRWGGDNHPRKCRNRQDVIATFDRWLDQGIDGEIKSIVATSNGVLCKFRVKIPNENDNGFRTLYHLYKTTRGTITEILPFESRTEAESAAELRQPR